MYISICGVVGVINYIVIESLDHYSANYSTILAV